MYACMFGRFRLMLGPSHLIVATAVAAKIVVLKLAACDEHTN